MKHKIRSYYVTLKKDCMYTCSQNVLCFQSYGFCTLYVLYKHVFCVCCMENIVFLVFRKHLHFVLLYGKYSFLNSYSESICILYI